MKPEDVNTIDDLPIYIEGCINDFEFGISDKSETIEALLDLILYLLKK